VTQVGVQACVDVGLSDPGAGVQKCALHSAIYSYDEDKGQ
jgi:hypothetical protein